MFDIIGDVHGEVDLLKDLLRRIGYTEENGLFSHPERKAIFVGDFINRGPKIRETIRLIRTMVENEKAHAILGNHEVNAIYYSLLDKQGKHLSKRWSRLRLDLSKTLDEFAGRMDEWKSHIKWMRTLPLFLEFDKIRVVHACWQDDNIKLLKETIQDPKLKRTILKMIGKNNSELSRAFWETCKGIDFKLPKDLLVYDNDGRAHRSFRSKWWENPDGKTFSGLSFESRFNLPSYTIPQEILPVREAYPESSPIVFFGHYCMKNGVNIVKSNVCCLDTCVSRRGKLTAYQWSGETKLDVENIIR